MKLRATLLACALAACGSSSNDARDAASHLDGARGDSTSHDGAPGDGRPPHPDHWVLGYYVGYEIDQMPISEIDWPALSHVAMAPMTVNTNGSLDESFDDGANGPTDAMMLATQAHAHGVVPLLMLGGAGAGPNIAAAAHGANRAAFVQTLLGALDDLGYDGLDLDWEDSVNVPDLVSLAQDLRAARPSIVLTYPGYPINPNFEAVDPQMVTLAAALDQFNIQTYYPTTAETGDGWDSWFLAPLSGSTGSTPVAIDDTFTRYADAGIPRAKLGMGTAFYAICYSSAITGPRQPTTTSDHILGGDNVFPLTALYAAGGTWDTHQAAIVRDATAKEPYLSLPTAVTDPHCAADPGDSATPTHYISYEDGQAFADKAAFAKSNGYGGIIVWNLQEGLLPANAAQGLAPDAMFDALGDAFLQ